MKCILKCSLQNYKISEFYLLMYYAEKQNELLLYNLSFFFNIYFVHSQINKPVNNGENTLNVK